jgi:hypothetical protein
MNGDIARDVRNLAESIDEWHLPRSKIYRGNESSHRSKYFQIGAIPKLQNYSVMLAQIEISTLGRTNFLVLFALLKRAPIDTAPTASIG